MPPDQEAAEETEAARAEEAAAPTVHRVSDTAYISTARDPDGNELHRIMTERRAPRYQRAVPTQPAATAAVREAAEMESDDSEVFGAADSLASEFEDDDGDEWEDGGDADEILAQARRAPPSFFSRHVWRSLWRDVTRLQHPPYLPTPPAAMPPPVPPPAKPTRKEDLHFLRDLIESVQEAQPDVVCEGAYLRSSNLLRDLFREEDAKEVRYEQRTGRPLPQNILAPPDEVNEVE